MWIHQTEKDASGKGLGVASGVRSMCLWITYLGSACPNLIVYHWFPHQTTTKKQISKPSTPESGGPLPCLRKIHTSPQYDLFLVIPGGNQAPQFSSHRCELWGDLLCLMKTGGEVPSEPERRFTLQWRLFSKRPEFQSNKSIVGWYLSIVASDGDLHTSLIKICMGVSQIWNPQMQCLIIMFSSITVTKWDPPASWDKLKYHISGKHIYVEVPEIRIPQNHPFC